MKKIIYSLLLFMPTAVRAVSLENPLRANSIPELVNNVIQGLLGVVGAIVLFFLVWGGIVWMTSSGNAERIRKGKDTIVWAIFGLVIIFLSYAIVKLVLTAIARP